MRPGPVSPAVPLSVLPAVAWPALPGPEAARLLALQYQFARSERWPPEELQRRQFTQLAALLRHAQATVPFYRERLRDWPAGVPPAAAFAALPRLTRAELQDNFASLASRAPLPAHGPVRESGTSGSTGRPIRFLATPLNDLFWRAFTLRDHLWHGRDFSGRLAAIRSRVREGLEPDWGEATAGVFTTGGAVLLNTTRPVHEQAAWLMRENPDTLISVGSNLLELARYCRSRGLRPPRLREARSYGDALHPEARDTVRAAWGVPLTDLYSCSEGGYLALQCPRHDHYHVQAEGVYLEVLDAQGQPCAPGETGRVVITPLHNYAMPLIRYEIGDNATVGAPCDCGRTLPVLAAIHGRVRNMLRLPDGSVRHPRFGEREFGGIAPVRQYQVVQKTLHDIEVALVVARPLTAAEEDALRALIVASLRHPFAVRFVYREAIARADSGKFEDFRSEVAG